MNDNENRLWTVLARHPYALAYVYWLDRRGRPITPYADSYCLGSAEELLTTILRKLGPGRYRIMVRNGRKMLFSGQIGVGPLPRHH